MHGCQKHLIDWGLLQTIFCGCLKLIDLGLGLGPGLGHASFPGKRHGINLIHRMVWLNQREGSRPGGRWDLVGGPRGGSCGPVGGPRAPEGGTPGGGGGIPRGSPDIPDIPGGAPGGGPGGMPGGIPGGPGRGGALEFGAKQSAWTHCLDSTQDTRDPNTTQ